MTVTAKTTRVQYTGTGLVKTYAYGWKILEDADLVVISTNTSGVDTTLTLTTDYTVTGAGTDAGGNVVLTNNLASGYKLTIYMSMDIDQPTDLTNQQSPFLERIEAALDRQALVNQQLDEKLGRCIQLKPTSTDSSDDLQELLGSVDTNATAAAASAATATTQAGLANTARIAAELAETNAEAAAASIPTFGAFGLTLAATTTASNARAALELGTAALVDTGTGAGKLVQLGEDGALPAVSAKNLTNLPASGIDLSMMNAILLWRSMGKASGAFPGGYLFTFQSAELAGVTNGAWNSLLKGYSNLSGTVQLLSGTAGGAYAAGNTNINRSAAIPNGKMVFKLGYYSTAAATVKLKIARRNSAGNYTIVHGMTCVHPGGGWVDFTLPTPYVVPSDGLEYFVGGYWASAMQHTAGTGLNATIGGDTTGTGTYTEAAGQNLVMVRAWYGAAANMTMPTTAITVGAVPNSLRAYFCLRVVDPTINYPTDIKLRASRDGGATWTAYTVPTFLCYWDAGYSHLYSMDFDLSALGSGTSIVVELSTYNLKEMCALALGYAPK